MKYNLVTTKNGQFPINEIKEGVEVLCHGEWIKAPKPIKSTVITCSFNTDLALNIIPSKILCCLIHVLQ